MANFDFSEGRTWAIKGRAPSWVPLIRFVIYSSLAHGFIMFGQALIDTTERGHFLGDIPALIIVGVVLEILLRRELAKP